MASVSFKPMALAVVAAYSGRDLSFSARVQFWIDLWGDKDVASLTTEDVEDGIDLLAKKPKTVTRTTCDGIKFAASTDKTISAATVNRYVAAIGTVFKDARRMRLTPRGFVSPSRGAARMTEGPGRALTVTLDDVQRLLAACRVSRNRNLAALVAMAVTTGWRRGSLQALRWQDVDLKQGTADTPRTKNGTPHRTPLLPWVVQELKQIRPDSPPPGALVFGAKSPHKAWQTALQRADLPPWTFHHCRHIAASILAQSGASTVTIMQALNHKTPMMAMRYSHLNTDALRESLGRAWG